MISSNILTPLTPNGVLAGLVSGGEGNAANSSAFAAMVAGFLAGEAAPAEAQEMSILPLFAGSLGAPAEDSTIPDEAEPWEAVLEQLAAWMGSLSAEDQRKYISEPEVAEWTALANAELAMAGSLEGSLPSSPQETHLPITSEGEVKPISDILEQLLNALRENPNQPYLSSVAKQAGEVFTKALCAAAAAEAPGMASASKATVQTALMHQAEAVPSPKSAQSSMDALLAKVNGQVQWTTAPRTDSGTANIRMSHLQAMQAKTALVHYAMPEGIHTALTAEAGAKVAEAAVTTDSGTPSSNAFESIKTTDPGLKLEASVPQRVPLTSVIEHLNTWMVKHAFGNGNLKTETMIKLMPEQLGQVEVKLSMQNGQLTATIVTESAMAKDVLESNLASLRASLQTQGVAVERLTVSQQQPSGFHSGMFQEGKQQRQSSGREEDRGQRVRKDDGTEDWADVLAVSSEQETAVLEAYGSGSSFRAKA